MIYNTMEDIFDLTGNKTARETIKKLFPEYSPLRNLTMRLQLHNIIQRANRDTLEAHVRQVEKDLIRGQHMAFLQRSPDWIYPISR